VMMSLFAKDGSPKIVSECTQPLTGKACVSRVYTEHAIVQLDPETGATVLASFGITIEALASRLNLPLRRP
jgi:3-oxoadipate CoA-transferase, beta subunit